jgi:hypothetical protein
MKRFKSYITEGAHDFKNFKDPWAVMSPKDRKEANRLFVAAMKAFPSSPRQIELHAKLEVLLKKYGIGQKTEEKTESKENGECLTELFDKPCSVREYQRLRIQETRDYKAEYVKMYGGDNPTPKQRKAMKKKTAEGRSNDGKEIDHKNGDALDSRPSNPRVVSRHTNRSKDWRRALARLLR